MSDGAVPFVDLHRQHAPIARELADAYERVLGAGSFILGTEVESFEREFAEYCGVAHCVGVSSGTAAITIAALAAGVGPGDEVIVPAHTFVASALGVFHAGATPVFADVNEATGLLDPEAAAAAIGPRTSAILAVHLYGQVCDMDALRAIAGPNQLIVLEDAAQAHGATWRSRRAGSFGSAAAFSFYPSKNLGALGDGGAVCTDDDAIAERARRLRNLGQRAKNDHVLPGFNERLDGLQAAFLRVKLPHLDAWNDTRRERAALYRTLIDSRLSLRPEPEDASSVHHLFPVRAPERDGFAERLRDAGIGTGVHYPHVAAALPPFAEPPEEYPAAARWAAEELSLPIFEHLTEAEVERVATAVRGALAAFRAAR
jgi:dTDP-4-amino-4,6-dideoxygalactose transaminase